MIFITNLHFSFKSVQKVQQFALINQACSKKTKTFIYLFLDMSSTWWTATWGAQAACNTSKWSDVNKSRKEVFGKIEINKIDPHFFY